MTTTTNKTILTAMAALAAVAVYWYMSTTEEERSKQREQIKNSANNAAKQVSGKFVHLGVCLLCGLWYKILTSVSCAHTTRTAAKDDALREAEKVKKSLNLNTKCAG